MAAAIGLLVLGFLWRKDQANFLNFTKKNASTIGTIVIAIGVVYGLTAVGIMPDIGLPFSEFTDGPIDLGFGEASAGAPAASGGAVASGGALVIENFAVSAKESGSDSRSAVDGFLRVYDSGVNPSSPTASAIDTVTVTDGSGTSTNDLVMCDTQYRVVFEGNSTNTNYYDSDKGVMSFPCSSFNPNTGQFTYDAGAIGLVGTFDDILNELNGSAGLPINGQSTNEQGDSVEIQCSSTAAADCTLMYDESVGDGVWYIDISPSCSVANGVCKDAVLHFVHDLSNPPEGNEYTSISAQLRSGTDMGVPSDLTNYWANEVPIPLGTLTAGQSATYRLTFTVVEDNEDGNDDWTIRFDDLGEHLGKDVRLNVRGTADTVTYGGSQA